MEYENGDVAVVVVAAGGSAEKKVRKVRNECVEKQN